MKRAGIAVIFELRDMIGVEGCSTLAALDDGHGGGRFAYVRAVPCPFYDGLIARIRSAWEVVCGRAYPCAWPKPGDFEQASGRTIPSPQGTK